MPQPHLRHALQGEADNLPNRGPLSSHLQQQEQRQRLGAAGEKQARRLSIATRRWQDRGCGLACLPTWERAWVTSSLAFSRACLIALQKRNSGAIWALSATAQTVWSLSWAHRIK